MRWDDGALLMSRAAPASQVLGAARCARKGSVCALAPARLRSPAKAVFGRAVDGRDERLARPARGRGGLWRWWRKSLAAALASGDTLESPVGEPGVWRADARLPLAQLQGEASAWLNKEAFA